MRPGGNAIREGSNNVSLEACLCVSGFSMQEVPVGFNKSLESKEAISTRASLVAVLLARTNSSLWERHILSVPSPHTSQSCPEVQFEAGVFCCPPLSKSCSSIAATVLRARGDFSRVAPPLRTSGTLAFKSSFLPSTRHWQGTLFGIA